MEFRAAAKGHISGSGKSYRGWIGSASVTKGDVNLSRFSKIYVYPP